MRSGKDTGGEVMEISTEDVKVAALEKSWRESEEQLQIFSLVVY